MWHENNTWLHYVKNIIAADISSAIFLASYLRHCNSSKNYAASLEIIDLQKYKVIKKEAKVRVALRERVNIPFVFVVGKNWPDSGCATKIAFFFSLYYLPQLFLNNFITGRIERFGQNFIESNGNKLLCNLLFLILRPFYSIL